MVNLPAIQGNIRRRILVNYRVEPAVMARALPAPFRPKLYRGHAVAGICLIRLESVRPRFMPLPMGFSSENAAHRVAVEWDEEDGVRDGVFIPRRDSDSVVNRMLGGWLFPGAQHAARFEVRDDGTHVELRMASRDGRVELEIEADPAPQLPPSSIFPTIEEASRFFERGALGYSSTAEPDRFDGLLLATQVWKVSPLAVNLARSSYFENRELFPEGSATFDHALVMRDIEHEWLSVPVMRNAAGGELAAACV